MVGKNKFWKKNLVPWKVFSNPAQFQYNIKCEWIKNSFIIILVNTRVGGEIVGSSMCWWEKREKFMNQLLWFYLWSRASGYWRDVIGKCEFGCSWSRQSSEKRVIGISECCVTSLFVLLDIWWNLRSFFQISFLLTKYEIYFRSFPFFNKAKPYTWNSIILYCMMSVCEGKCWDLISKVLKIYFHFVLSVQVKKTSLLYLRSPFKHFIESTMSSCCSVSFWLHALHGTPF